MLIFHDNFVSSATQRFHKLCIKKTREKENGQQSRLCYRYYYSICMFCNLSHLLVFWEFDGLQITRSSKRRRKYFLLHTPSPRPLFSTSQKKKHLQKKKLQTLQATFTLPAKTNQGHQNSTTACLPTTTPGGTGRSSLPCQVASSSSSSLSCQVASMSSS